MKTLCQPDKQDICTQCGRRVPRGMHLTCQMKDAATAEREGRVARHSARRWLRDQLQLDVRPPCAFLGPATGELLKTGCGRGRHLPEHVCYHAARRWWSRRRAAWRDAKCSPTGVCNDASLGIQACAQCPLYEAQRFLAGTLNMRW